MLPLLSFPIAVTLIKIALGTDLTFSSSPVKVKHVTPIGIQHSKQVPNVHRDGGHSVLLSGKVIWLYDDTECRGAGGKLDSFVPNSATYQTDSNGDLTAVRDFTEDGTVRNAWIPFTDEERRFNEQENGGKRIAICRSLEFLSLSQRDPPSPSCG